MPDDLPGLHHCIGTARTVTDVVFRTLRAQCAASGGALSLEDLEKYYLKIIDSFSSGFDVFELKHHNCMGASLGMAAMPFARDRILATLLRACGEKSARAVFALQVDRLGLEWLGQFFDGLAQYMRQHVNTNIDRRLIDAYVETATIPKIKLSIQELLTQDSVKHIMLECVTAFEALDAPQSLAKGVCDSVNRFVSVQRDVEGPHVCKVTREETCRFLTLLPRQLRATLSGMPLTEHAAKQKSPVV